MKNLRRSFRLSEKIINDEYEDDIEYLKHRINYLNKLFKGYTKKNKYCDKNIKCHGIETIKFLFVHHEELCLYLTNYQQYQSFSDKTLLTLNEYLERIRAELTSLRNKQYCKLTVDAVFRLKMTLMIREPYILKVKT